MKYEVRNPIKITIKNEKPESKRKISKNNEYADKFLNKL